MIVLSKEEKTVAANIKRLMEEHDPPLSYPKLGELSGVNFATIHDFLSGRSSPKWINVKRLADALGVEMSDLEKPAKSRKLAKSA